MKQPVHILKDGVITKEGQFLCGVKVEVGKWYEIGEHGSNATCPDCIGLRDV